MTHALRRNILALSAAALLVGCQEPTGRQAGDEPAPGAAATPNNSDPGKPGYAPKAKAPKVETSYEELDHTPGYKGLDDYLAQAGSAPLSKVASPQRWVGVMPMWQAGYAACPESQKVRIRQDDEDTNNESRTSAVLPYGAADGEGNNTTMWFCKVPGTSLRPLYDANYLDDYASTNDYAVLRLDDQCPEYSQSFGLRVDNEDTGNNNSNSGNIWPSVQAGSYSILYFCYFRSVPVVFYPRMPALPYVNSDYAVFSTANATPDYFRQLAWVYSDDEDTGNSNKFILDGLSDGDRVRVKKIIYQYRQKFGTQYNMGIINP